MRDVQAGAVDIVRRLKMQGVHRVQYRQFMFLPQSTPCHFPTPCQSSNAAPYAQSLSFDVYHTCSKLFAHNKARAPNATPPRAKGTAVMAAPACDVALLPLDPLVVVPVRPNCVDTLAARLLWADARLDASDE